MPFGTPNYCTCACHRQDGIMHVMACCEYTYQNFNTPAQLELEELMRKYGANNVSQPKT